MTPARRGRTGSGGLDHLRATLRKRRDPGDEEISKHIAAQVLARRRAWDLSQEELADLCGTTQSAIARLERGLRPPRIDTLLRIARALDAELIVELRPRTEEE